MGQVLSNIIRIVLGETGNDNQRTNEHSHPIALPNLTLPREPITRCYASPQTQSDICSTAPTSYGSINGPFRVNSHGYCTSSTGPIYGKAEDDEEIANGSLVQPSTGGSMQPNLLNISQQCFNSLHDLPRHNDIFRQSWDYRSYWSCGDPLDINVDARFETLLRKWSTANVSLDPPLSMDSSIQVLKDSRRVTTPLSELSPMYTSGEETRKRHTGLSKPVRTKEKWIKHYSNRHNILLVGEGDFSFSTCLAMAFGSANKMIATSLNSEDFLRANYGKAISNIQNLKRRGCKVMHDVDATKMACHSNLKGMTFDRIIFNFPLAGFFPSESRKSELRRHRKLVRNFLANAKTMMTEMGEIHISHKSNGFFLAWNLQVLASHLGLQLVEEAHDFNLSDYPGYHTKYGFGGDDDFNCNPSKTYKFGL